MGSARTVIAYRNAFRGASPTCGNVANGGLTGTNDCGPSGRLTGSYSLTPAVPREPPYP